MSVLRLTLAAAAALTLSACAYGPRGGMGYGMHQGMHAGGPMMSTADWSARMDAHMKAMQTLHEAMAKAQTPEERAALMASHRALMHEGGAMMHGMPCATPR